MNERYLPIGSVVKLKNSNKLIMVIGYYSVEYKQDIIVYDYSGCAYPEGIMLKSNYCSFNHNDIKEVLFVGYKNEEYNDMNNKLNIIDDDLINDVEKIDNKVDKETKHNDFFSIEEPEELKMDTIEEKEEEFVLPHYEFDDNGIIINN